MKKLLAIAVVLLLTVGLLAVIGCGDTSTDSGAEKTEGESAAPQAPGGYQEAIDRAEDAAEEANKQIEESEKKVQEMLDDTGQ